MLSPRAKHSHYQSRLALYWRLLLSWLSTLRRACSTAEHKLRTTHAKLTTRHSRLPTRQPPYLVRLPLRTNLKPQTRNLKFLRHQTTLKVETRDAEPKTRNAKQQ